MSANCEDSAASKFEQNPLISTVLWMLGSGGSSSSTGKLEGNKSMNSIEAAAALKNNSHLASHSTQEATSQSMGSLKRTGALGDVQGTTNSNKENPSISWKIDQHGGDMHEYINAVQSNSNSAASSLKTEEVIQLARSPSSANYLLQQASDLNFASNIYSSGPDNSHNRNSNSSSSSTTASAHNHLGMTAAYGAGSSASSGVISLSPQSTPSPQWGQFTTLTPEEQQEKYEAQRRSIESVNSLYASQMQERSALTNNIKLAAKTNQNNNHEVTFSENR